MCCGAAFRVMNLLKFSAKPTHDLKKLQLNRNTDSNEWAKLRHFEARRTWNFGKICFFYYIGNYLATVLYQCDTKGFTITNFAMRPPWETKLRPNTNPKDYYLTTPKTQYCAQHTIRRVAWVVTIESYRRFLATIPFWGVQTSFNYNTKVW